MSVMDWLMEGDPAVRWQVKRDLLNFPGPEWHDERLKVGANGWAASIFQAQNPDRSWPQARWTGTVWVVPILMDLGVLPTEPRLTNALDRVVDWLLPAGADVTESTLKTKIDLCHLGFYLRIGSYFATHDPRLRPIAQTILDMQFDDGGWNCRIRTKPGASHGSFHTTFNVLEGLREAAAAGIVGRDAWEDAESKALEFMLDHQLYRSDKTGKIVSQRFLELTYPSYWHYNVLRALDYIRLTPFIRDPRLSDPLDWLETRRNKEGRWVVEKPIAGIPLVKMESLGKESRWNTLRALRVLKAAGRN